MRPLDAPLRAVVAEVGVRHVKTNLIPLAARVVIAPQRFHVKEQLGLKSVVHPERYSATDFQVVIQRLGEILARDFRLGLNPQVRRQTPAQRRFKADLFPNHLHRPNVVLGQRRVKYFVDVNDTDVGLELPMLRQAFFEADIEQAGLFRIHALGVEIAALIQRAEHRDLHPVFGEWNPDGHKVETN